MVIERENRGERVVVWGKGLKAKLRERRVVLRRDLWIRAKIYLS